MKTDQDNQLTITLTDRPPVRINKDNWPVIARGCDYEGEFESQSNRTSKIIVRQNTAGKAIVYGIYSTRWQGENDKRGGILTEPGADIPAAIKQVAEAMGFPDSLAQECLASLPAEDLD